MADGDITKILVTLERIETKQQIASDQADRLAQKVDSLPCPRHLEMLGRLDERVTAAANAAASAAASAREAAIQAAGHASENAEKSRVYRVKTTRERWTPAAVAAFLVAVFEAIKAIVVTHTGK